MADARDFRVKAGGSPLTGAAGSFVAIARGLTGAVRSPPAIVELGEGVYRFTPTDADETAGTVVSIDLGVGREPRRVTVACYKPDRSNQFWAVAVENPDGSTWAGAAPTIGSYRSSAGSRTAPALVAVDGAWLFVAVPTNADMLADVEILIVGPAGSSQPEWLGSTSPVAAIGFVNGQPITPTPVPDVSSPLVHGHKAYTRQLKQLLPPGLLDLDSDSVLTRTLEAVANELTRVDKRGADLIDESDPRTANETLSDWTRALGLPDDRVPVLPATTEGLRVAVTQKLVGRGGQNYSFFALLCAACGYPLTSIDRFVSQMLRVGFRVGDRVYGRAYAFTIRLNLAAASPNALPHADFERVIRHATHTPIGVMFTYA